jgi:putative ABC transport system permease protein
MALVDMEKRAQLISISQQWTRDAHMGFQNLLLHGLRSLLTMLGMIFGVAAVVSMLSIGAGARQKVMALIEQMGVHNLIVEAKETMEWQAHQKVRKISPGLTLLDYRVIADDLDGIVASTPRKRMTPSKMIPKPQQDMPVIYGVNPDYRKIAGLQLINGRFFDKDDEDAGAPVCVLGASARWSIFGSADAVGEFVKVNEQWFRVIGVVSPQLSSDTAVAGLPSVDVNNAIYVPLQSAFQRLEDS